MIEYTELLRHLDSQVDRVLATQVMDENRADWGGFVSPADGLVGPTNVSSVALPASTFVLPESRYYNDSEILERVLLAAAYARRVRRPSGCFDLLITNFDSAPDTGFVVQRLAPVVRLARRQAQRGNEGAGQIAAALGELISTAAAGMAAGGFHTPNHRWVLTAALAQAWDLFPELEVMDVIEAYLGEGIDINADGEYIERSTGVYNAVCNRALRFAARILERPELLEPVRRNLDLSYHLMHGDGTVITNISSRQDRGTRTVPGGLVDSYFEMAHLDGNGFYGSVAEWLYKKEDSTAGWLLCLLAENPQWQKNDLPREALPDAYAKVYPTSGLWRVRRQQLSATAAAGITAPFAVRYGETVLTAVKIASTYFATGQFVGEDFSGGEGEVFMRHRGRNQLYPEKDYVGGVYWLPIDEQVDAGNWRQVRGRRQTYELPALEVELHIREVEGGFDLKVQTAGGVDGVPLQIECDFASGGECELDSGVVQGTAGNAVFLKEGYATYRVGGDAIAVGPGCLAHRMWAMRNSEIDDGAFRVLITLLTPVDRVLEIRAGAWSAVEERLIV
jgi:hypothetical protein